MRRPTFRYLALMAAVAVFAPSNASAQLGRLKKAATDAAKDAAGVKEPAAASNNGNNFTITAERLSAVMAAMAPVMQQAELESASRATIADHNKKKKAFESCVEGLSKGLVAGATPSMEGIQRSGAISEKSVALMQRSLAAQQGKRYREYVAANDTMGAYAALTVLAMYNLEAKCGQPVYMTPAMLDIEAAKIARAGSGEVGENGKEKMTVPPANRAGMTTHQFGMVRERAALWALQQTNNAPVGNNKYGVFTSEEAGVLEAQGALLRKWAPFFKDQPALWATWADLSTW